MNIVFNIYMLDLVPETEPKSRPYLFIGALPNNPIPEPEEFRRRENYHEAYITNVNLILKCEGAIPITGKVDLGAANIRRQPPFNFTLLNAYGNWSANNPFTPQKTYVTYDEAALSFPQDCFVAGENIIVVNPQRKFILNGIGVRGLEILEDERLSEGGRLAIGEGLVFASFGNLTDPERNILESLFPSKKVIYVPPPTELGIRDKNRHRFHIDQFIGGPLQLKDGRLLVPIDNIYFEKAAGSLPTIMSKDGKETEVIYLPLNCSNHYLLNYPVTPRGKFYLGSELARLLSEAGHWSQIGSPVKTLPAELPVFEDYQAGMKCKLNLV